MSRIEHGDPGLRGLRRRRLSVPAKTRIALSTVSPSIVHLPAAVVERERQLLAVDLILRKRDPAGVADGDYVQRAVARAPFAGEPVVARGVQARVRIVKHGLRPPVLDGTVGVEDEPDNYRRAGAAARGPRVLPAAGELRVKLHVHGRWRAARVRDGGEPKRRT